MTDRRSTPLVWRTAAARRAVTCPTCAAVPGQPCGDGERIWLGAHPARTFLADRLADSVDPTQLHCEAIAREGDNTTHHIVRGRCRTCGKTLPNLRYAAVTERAQ